MKSTDRNLRILIDARIEKDKNGGIEQALIGLAESFSIANFSDLNFGWLISEGSSLFDGVDLPKKSELIILKNVNRKLLLVKFIEIVRRIRLGDRIIGTIRGHGPLAYKLPREPFEVTQWNPDLIHFPTQFGFSTSIPNVYQPHDFQHHHFPQNFSLETLSLRTIGYGGMIEQSSCVVVGNEWTKIDFRHWFPDYRGLILNIPVIPCSLEKAQEIENLENELINYIFYPASYWPHKNHELLIKAHKKLNDEGFRIKLVLCGFERNSNFENIVKEYGIPDQIVTLGRVNSSTLEELYRRAFCLVMPSFFESESLPLWEAARYEVPIIAANVTAISSQIDTGALLFDPNDVEDLKNSIIMILQDKLLRNQLISDAKTRLNLLTAENTAKGYRFAYRQALNISMDSLDENFLFDGFRF